MDLHGLMKDLPNFIRGSTQSKYEADIYIRKINPKFMVKISSNDSLHIRIIKDEFTDLNQIWELEPELKAFPVKNLSIHFSMKEFKISTLPETVENLVIESLNFNDYLDNLPINLKTLIINAYRFDTELNNLPQDLENLEIKCYYYDKQLDNLPLGLKRLFIGRLGIECQLNNLPLLRELEIEAGDTKNKLNNLPKTLEKLIIGQLMHSLENINFPESITRMEIREMIGRYRLSNFPKNLKILALGRKSLNMDTIINVTLVNLPDIEELIITDPNYDHDLCHLPKSIKIIKIDKFFWSPNEATRLYKRVLGFKTVMAREGFPIEIKEIFPDR